MSTHSSFGAILSTLAVLLTASPLYGATHTPKDGPSLQAAIQAAVPGDEILLAPGVLYVIGDVVIPKKPAGAVITIRSSAVLPDRRITALDASLLPIITSGNAGSALSFIGVTGWRLDGIRFEVTAQEGFIQIQDSDHIVMDRILAIGPGGNSKRGIKGNGKNITLTRSHIANIWINTLQDAQAFCAWDGAGPYTLKDNYLEASGENVMFGGANNASPANIPADILVEGNHMAKPLSWKGQARGVKNLFELKAAKRAIIRNNLFENNWTDAQNGYAILMTGRNDQGGSPWSVVEDVTFERNIVRNTENGINVLGYDSYQASGRTQRITIRHNLIQASGVAFQFGGEVGALVVDHNTVLQGHNLVTLYKGGVWPAPATSGRPAAFAVEHLTWTNNVARHNEYGVVGEDAGIGSPALTALTKAFTWTNNVLAGEFGNPYPSTTFKVTLAELAAQLAPDSTLATSSPFRGKATDGTDLGWGGMIGGFTPPPPPPPLEEVCGNQTDDDKDGQIDEGCEVEPPPPPPPPTEDVTPPTIVSVSITRSGSSSNFPVTVKAQDAQSGVASVEVYLNGNARPSWLLSQPNAVGGDVYSDKVWISTNGTHTVRIVVYDQANNKTETTRQVVRK